MDEHNHEPKATDPVCGMRVAHDAELRIEYRGVTYRFCDPACAETFRDEPDRWTGVGSDKGVAHAHHQ
jgi:YHS domain-containing protein